MGFVDRLTGKTAQESAERAADTQVQFAQEASALLDPFQQLGQAGLSQAGFLTDPQAQFNFLQNNPLFQAAQNVGQQATQRAQSDLFKSAAARGRLSAGDTIEEIQRLGDLSSQNLLLQAQPLIDRQTQNIGNLLNIGQNVAANQGSLLTGQGAALAGGIIGGENARARGQENLFNLAGGIGGLFFSDPSLKENIELIGSENGFNIYSWEWNDKAEKLGLSGSDSGVMADEVFAKNPSAVSFESGYMKVNYDAIGVDH
jgi:hypothetical protein